MHFKYFFSSFLYVQLTLLSDLLINNEYLELHFITSARKFLVSFPVRKVATIWQLNPYVVSFCIVKNKCHKLNICPTLLLYNNINWKMSLDDKAKCISSDLFFSTELSLWSLKSTYLEDCLSMSNNSLSSVIWDFPCRNVWIIKANCPLKKNVNVLSKNILVWRKLPSPLAGLVFQSTNSLHRSAVPIQLLSD